MRFAPPFARVMSARARSAGRGADFKGMRARFPRDAFQEL
jgi:hypothetical protein